MGKLKNILIAICVLALIGGGIYLLSNGPDKVSEQSLPTSYEYYWGDGCPHCLIVAEFLESWDGKDKISIDKKEVWNSKVNYLLMQQRAKYCNIDKNDLGVPLLFTPDGKCFVGDQPIIDLFKSLTF